MELPSAGPVAASQALNAPSDFKYPPLPTTFAETVRLLALPEDLQDPSDLVDLIHRDPMATAYVLRRINSAYYGISRSVSSVDRAVLLLGFRPVCNLLVALGLKQTFTALDGSEEQAILDHIMKTSVAAAAYARDFADHLGLPMAEMAFTGGLLHQVGRLILLYTAPESYTVLWGDKDPLSGELVIFTPGPQREREFFGSDYVAVGTKAAKRWDFPDKLLQLLTHHRRPGGLPDAHLRALALTVSAGSGAARLLYEGEPPPTARSADPARLAPTLMALARMRGTDTGTLMRLLEGRTQAVRQFADAALAA